VTRILTLKQHVVIARPVAEVFTYASDFGRAHEWRAGVIESTMSSAIMATGTRLREVATLAGRQIVTICRIADFRPGRRFTFEHVEGPLPVFGWLRCDPYPSGTLLTYTLNLELTGVAALAAPLLRRSGDRMLRRSLETLRRRAETLQPAG
jgi:uncharacterized membrane protein